MGCPKFVSYKSKPLSEINSYRSFVEMVKAPVQARVKHLQQPLIIEKGKNRIVEKKVDPPRDKNCTQVVVFKSLAGKSSLIVVGGVEGRDRDTKWNNKFEVKIQEGNKH